MENRRPGCRLNGPVWLRVLLDDFRHQVKPRFNLGRDCLKQAVLIGFGDDVIAQALRHILSMGHRCYC